MSKLLLTILVTVLGLILWEPGGRLTRMPTGRGEQQQPRPPVPQNGLIVFPGRDTQGRQQLFTITPDGANRRQLTFENDNSLPSWSPDGAQMVYVSRTPTPYLTIMNADGGNKRTLRVGDAPDWGPNGLIVFTSANQPVPNSGAPAEIWVVGSDGSAPRQVTFGGSHAGRVHPSWSPDGTRIVYMQLTPQADNDTSNGCPALPFRAELWIINADGANARLLTTPGFFNYDSNGQIINSANHANAPDWSAAGDYITFWSGQEQCYGQVWRINADGSGRTQLTKAPIPSHNDDPAWSPDGTQVLFTTDRIGRPETWVMNADGSNPRFLTESAPGPGPADAAWQPTTSTTLGACPASGISSSSGAIDLASNCNVVGNITLSGTASLTMTGAVLSVTGNIVLRDQAQLTVTSGGLTFPQTDNFQYSMTLNNSTHLTLRNSTLVTNGTSQNNFTVNLNAYNTSVVDFESSNKTRPSWLLGNFHDQSQLIVNNSTELPTEIYPSDASQISIANSNFAGVWLEFVAGSSGAINVPQKDAQGNFDFDFGGSTGFNYRFHQTASRMRLGLNTHPNSSMTVNGGGTGSTTDADVIFGYFVDNNSAPITINGLDVGPNVTRQFTDQGRNLSLNNVNLNPFSWQVYISNSNGFPVTVSNSKINEIAALTNGRVNISNSILQLAVTGAVGPGSRMNIDGTQIWSNTILARNGGQVSITNSQIHGNFISAAGAGSSISMSTSTTENRNGSAGMSCAPVNGYPPNTNGVPLCNPQNPIGQCSQVSAARGGVVTGMPACNAIANVSAASYISTSLSPESIVSAFGSGLATTTLAASSTPLPTTLAGTTVKVRDSAGAERLAPLFFVSPAQVNYQMPAGTNNGASTISVTSSDGSVSTGVSQITSVAPGLFTANARGQGVAAALALRIKADGT
ncbi:MAG: hypothetical protein ACREEM_26965, partial [Blastocatellia bacterium]